MQGLGLVFVAVYQRALKLLYVDELLARLKAEFPAHYKPKQFDYPAFTDAFERARAELEAGAEAAGRHRGQQAPRAGIGRKVRLPSRMFRFLLYNDGEEAPGNTCMWAVLPGGSEHLLQTSKRHCLAAYFDALLCHFTCIACGRSRCGWYMLPVREVMAATRPTLP